MDFEVSCWSTGPLTNAGQTFYNCDNPVQRRPKIDYFDSSSITPIVSHISSNGYYGYCPTTNIKTSCAEQRSNAKDSADTIVPMESIDTEQFQHQGRSAFENRKRAIQCITDDFAEQDAKRRRNHLSVIDYVEDIQMGDGKDIILNSSNIATNKFEKLFVCINENLIPIELNARPQQTQSDAKCIRSVANFATKKTDDDNSAQNEDTTTHDMENLYWHTHGSLLWQR